MPLRFIYVGKSTNLAQSSFCLRFAKWCYRECIYITLLVVLISQKKEKLHSDTHTSTLATSSDLLIFTHF